MKKFFILISLCISFNTLATDNIQKDIRKLKRMKKKHRVKIARLVDKTSKKYDINPKIILSLIKIESNFEQSGMNKYKCKKYDSECGDFSIAQINYKIWKKAAKLNLHKLKSNNAYAIDRMGKILSILKKRYKSDKLWFLRYHSGSYLFKIRYLRMVERHFKKIGYNLDYKAKEDLLRRAVYKHGWKEVIALFTKIPSVDPLIKY